MTDENHELDPSGLAMLEGLSRRKVLGGLATAGAGAAIGGFGTQALLSDTETLPDNTLAAGELDLVLDWEEHYSDWSPDEAEGVDVRMEEPDEEGFVGLPDPANPLLWVPEGDLGTFMDNTAVEAFPDGDGDGVQDPLEQYDACADFANTPDDLDPTDSLRTDNSDTVDEDGDVKPLISLDDVKPGDFGELTLSFHLCDNDGFVWLQGGLSSASENGVTEAEADSDAEGDGVELFEQVRTLLWYDDDGDNVLDEGEEVIFRGSLRELLRFLSRDSGIPLDGDRETSFDELEDPPSAEGRECFVGSTTNAIGLAWWLPPSAGNEIQTDSVTFDLGVYAEQCRHNQGTGQAGQIRPEPAEGTVTELTTEDMVFNPPDGVVTPPEEFPVSEAEFEELKEQASNGELPQPPAENIEEEAGLAAAGESASSSDVSAQQQQRQIVELTGFDGWESSELGAVPPDPNLAVGPEHVVLAVNLRWGIYSKSGNRQFQVRLDDWFAPVIDEDENFVFDPKALYDHHSGRFVLAAVARNSTDQEGSWVVAVSDDSNPFGTWWVTRIPHFNPNSSWVDYPGLGVDRNGIYLTGNIFGFTGGYQKTQLISIDKTPLYNGNSFTYWGFDDLRNPNGSKAFTVQPTHGITSSGTQHLVNSRWNSGNTLTLWKLNNPTSSPSLSRQNVSVASYSLPPDAEQPDTTTRLDTVDARLMNAVYANGSVWTAHSISYDWNNNGDASALLKWYEIDTSSGSIAQSRGWGRPEADYFFPTIARNPERRSTMIVYSESDAESVFPRIEVAGRTDAHTQNSLEDVEVLKFGEAEFGGGGTNRWGDYSGIVLDPSFGSFWAFSEYGKDDATSNEWGTWVGEARFQSRIQ